MFIHLGAYVTHKMDVFFEKFQTAFDPPPLGLEFFLAEMKIKRENVERYTNMQKTKLML